MKSFCLFALLLVSGYFVSGLVLDKFEPFDFPEIQPLELGIHFDDEPSFEFKAESSSEAEFVEPPVPLRFSEENTKEKTFDFQIDFQTQLEEEMKKPLSQLQNEAALGHFKKLPPYPERSMHSKNDDPRAIALDVKEEQAKVAASIAKHKAEQKSTEDFDVVDEHNIDSFAELFEQEMQELDAQIENSLRQPQKEAAAESFDF